MAQQSTTDLVNSLPKPQTLEEQYMYALVCSVAEVQPKYGVSETAAFKRLEQFWKAFWKVAAAKFIALETPKDNSVRREAIQDSAVNLVKLADDVMSYFATTDSPHLVGSPTVPTATAGSNTEQIANTSFVQGELGGYVKKGTSGYLKNASVTSDEQTQVQTLTITRGDNSTIVFTPTGGGSGSTISWDDIVSKPTFSTVATSGSYNDLLNRPTIPTVPTNISAFTNDSGYITGVAWGDVTNKPSFATVATSGSYNDLSNKPTIPTVPTNVSSFTNDAGYITGVAWADVTDKPATFTPASHTHNYAGSSSAGGPATTVNATEASANRSRHVWFSYNNTDHHGEMCYNDGFQYNPSTNVLTVGSITGSAGSVAWGNVSDKPTFATVATSGSYSDLSNKPTIPTMPTITTGSSDGTISVDGTDVSVKGLGTFAYISGTSVMLDTTSPKSITANSDLNDYKTDGTYISGSSTVTSSLSNCPHTNSGFKMVVLRTISANYLLQIIYTYYGLIYVRGLNNGTWLSWNCLQRGLFYTCSTAVGTAAKTVGSGAFRRYAGLEATVLFTNGNTADNITLKIGTDSAIAVYYLGSRLGSANPIPAGMVVKFVYDGTYWQVVGKL